MFGDQSNLNMGIKIGGKGIGLVAAQIVIEAYSRMMNGNVLPPLYIHTYACGRAGVQACGRASVDKNEFKRGVISVRSWSVKRAGVEWQSYKARLLYYRCILSN